MTTPGDGPLPPAESGLAKVGLSLPSMKDGDTQGWVTPCSACPRVPAVSRRLNQGPPAAQVPPSFTSISCSAPSALTLTLGTESGGGGAAQGAVGAGVQKGYLGVSKHSPFLRWADEPGAGAWARGAWWGAEYGRPREVGLGNARSWGLDPSPGRGLRGWLEGPLAQLHVQKMSDPRAPGLLFNWPPPNSQPGRWCCCEQLAGSLLTRAVPF